LNPMVSACLVAAAYKFCGTTSVPSPPPATIFSCTAIESVGHDDGGEDSVGTVVDRLIVANSVTDTDKSAPFGNAIAIFINSCDDIFNDNSPHFFLKRVIFTEDPLFVDFLISCKLLLAGIPVGVVSHGGGIIAASERANEGTYIEAVTEAMRKGQEP
jgi:hypothetical protein